MKIKKILSVLLLLIFILPQLALANVYKRGDTNAKIATVQKSLVVIGLKVDRTDGVFSKKTVSAVKTFQKRYKQYKLKATGMIDDSTYKAIVAESNAKKGKGEPTSAKGSAIVKTASQYKGVPYIYGGTSEKGFDCSAYIQFVFKKHGVGLTRTADTQFKEGKFVLKKDLRQGDLVFFETYAKGASHVGVYAGTGKFWHVSSSKGVMLSGLEEDYWKKRYIGSRRVLK